MPYILFRHDDDEGDEEKETYKFDNKLVNGGNRHKIQKLVEKLVLKYGMPHRIFCSPMRRTRETLKIVSRHLTRGLGHTPEGGIWIDNRLSRYFTSDELGYSISPCTKKYKIPMGESVSQLEERIRNFVKHMEKKGYHRDKGEVVWVITHAVPFVEICELNGLKTHSTIDFLEYRKIST